MELLTSKESLRHWLRLAPIALPLRIYAPIYRVITGRPITRFSRIQPHLWVGGQQYRRGVANLHANGIRAVLNMRSHPDDRAFDRLHPEIDYLWLPTTDNQSPSMEHIQRGVDFIREHVEAGHDVYVHCRAGVGRGPTMAACYLISTGMTPADAWQTLRRKRPFVFPSAPQLAQVQSYYEHLQHQAPDA